MNTTAANYDNPPAIESIRLTAAQVKALEKISQPGGHGFGEYSNLRRSTANALKAKGLVWFSVRRFSSGRLADWAGCTVAGVAYLEQLKAERDAEYARWATATVNSAVGCTVRLP